MTYLIEYVQKTKGGEIVQKEVDTMRLEFKAVMLLILDLLTHGNSDRAIVVIREILKE